MFYVYLLKVNELSQLELCKISYRFTNEMLSRRLINLFDLTQHSHETRQSHNPNIPVNYTEIYNKSYTCRAPSYWLQLPNELKERNNIKHFNKKLKTYYLNMY